MKLNRLSQLSIAAFLVVLSSFTANAHSGHHEGDSILVQMFHWLWEPDHMLILGLAVCGVVWALKSKRLSRAERP